MVRFHPSELVERKSSEWMRTLLARQVAASAACGFESHGFRLRAHGPTGRHRLRKPGIQVQFPVGPLITQHGPVA